MSQSVAEITANAADAADAARCANNEAEKGRAVVATTVEGIQALEKTSKRQLKLLSNYKLILIR